MTRKILLLFILVVLSLSCTVFGEDKPLYLDSMATPEQRTEDLLARMTLREKLGQITQIEVTQMLRKLSGKCTLEDSLLQKVIVQYGAGSIISGGDGAPTPNSPEVWAKMTNTLQEWSLKTRLKIPVLYGIDAVHGHNNVAGATIYPYNLGLAATFNPDIAREYAALTAEEVAATGIQWTFAPVLDVGVDPRWGRINETLGEDPYLVSMIGSSQIIGFQQSGKIIACAKHFTGYSAPDDGHDRHPATVSERDFREIHFPPYQAAIKAGIASVMINSGAINGTPAHASKWLLIDILRGEMGFAGLLDSDWGDVNKIFEYHKFASSQEEALTMAYNAGMDLNMVPMDVTVVDKLEQLVNNNKIPMSRIDDAVRHMLYIKFKLGLFEKRTVNPDDAGKMIGSEQSKIVARKIAQQSMTLLRNDGNLLPISKKVKSILVTGYSANSLSRLCGGWTLHWMGANDEELKGKTVLDAIKEKVGSGTKVSFIEDSQDQAGFIKAAKAAGVTVVVVGEDPYAEMNGDSPTLRLLRGEEKIIESLQKAKLPFILVVAAGRPIILPGEEKAAPTILWTFLPGTEGGSAIADVLFGDYNPSGRLPISFPRNTKQLPVMYYRPQKNGQPMFEFGDGLSYTTFDCTTLNLPESVKVGKSIKVTVKIKNTGKLDGERVILLFAKHKDTTLPIFAKQLVGFTRVNLKPGEEKAVSFEIKPEQLSYWNEQMKFVEEPGGIVFEAEGKSGTLNIVK
jgi:beta-glucosidase